MRFCFNEALVAEAKACTDNLSATLESLLSDFVDHRQDARLDRQRKIDACVADWNAVHATIGSFADEHSTL